MTAWNSREIAFLRENAGKLTRRELQYALKRSDASIEHQARRMGISLRVPTWRLKWCVECANWRTELNDKTGRCKVCTTKHHLNNTKSKCVALYAHLNAEQKNAFRETRETFHEPKPKLGTLAGMTPFQESKRRQAYLRRLEEWEYRRVNMQYQTERKRLERLRKAINK